MKPVDGDEALFTLRKDDQLGGLTILHVDDFLLAGTSEFQELLHKHIGGTFTLSKAESGTFKFTGLDIKSSLTRLSTSTP